MRCEDDVKSWWGVLWFIVLCGGLFDEKSKIQILSREEEDEEGRRQRAARDGGGARRGNSGRRVLQSQTSQRLIDLHNIFTSYIQNSQSE